MVTTVNRALRAPEYPAAEPQRRAAERNPELEAEERNPESEAAGAAHNHPAVPAVGHTPPAAVRHKPPAAAAHIGSPAPEPPER